MPSWCQAAKVGEPGSLMKKVLVQTRMLGPITSLDRVEDARMADQCVEPGGMGVGVRAPFDVGIGDG